MVHLLSQAEKVPNAPFGTHELRVPGILLNLLAQIPDVKLQVVHVIRGLWSPDLEKQIVMGQDAPGMPDERIEKTELGGGKLDTLTTYGDRQSGGVEQECMASRCDGTLHRSPPSVEAGAAEHRLKARQQFIPVTGLGDEVVGAKVQSAH
jgi:hypothetical protein